MSFLTVLVHNKMTLARMLRKLEEAEVTSIQKQHITSKLQGEARITQREKDKRLTPFFIVKRGNKLQEQTFMR